MAWKRRARWLSLGSALVCAAACGATAQALVRATPRALQDGTWRWLDDGGRQRSLRELPGRVVVLSMFFCSCSYACPTTLARMQGLERAFAERAIDARFVLVTLDPTNDTPQHLAAFRRHHGLSPSWTLLTGTLEQTRALSRALALHRAEDATHILHDARIFILRDDRRSMRVFDGWNFPDAATLTAQ